MNRETLLLAVRGHAAFSQALNWMAVKASLFWQPVIIAKRAKRAKLRLVTI